MAELRAHNVAEGMMVDEGLAVLTSRRLAQYHREGSGLSACGPASAMRRRG